MFLEEGLNLSFHLVHLLLDLRQIRIVGWVGGGGWVGEIASFYVLDENEAVSKLLWVD